MRQKDQLELNLGTGAKGEALTAAAQEVEARAAKACPERPAVSGPSMEAMVECENLKQALAQVKRNKGAAGVDGMRVGDLPAHLKEHWPAIRAQLLDGTYKPQPVRRVEIPKASGGTRPLGIPTWGHKAPHAVCGGMMDEDGTSWRLIVAGVALLLCRW